MPAFNKTRFRLTYAPSLLIGAFTPVIPQPAMRKATGQISITLAFKAIGSQRSLVRKWTQEASLVRDWTQGELTCTS